MAFLSGERHPRTYLCRSDRKAESAHIAMGILTTLAAHAPRRSQPGILPMPPPRLKLKMTAAPSKKGRTMYPATLLRL